jgi:aerobic-type carbon monoxide dehydrogenase small subunit (CoxS/CutS family)
VRSLHGADRRSRGPLLRDHGFLRRRPQDHDARRDWTPEKPHPVQAAWIEEQVNQCGYCISGWILTAVELFDRNPKPTDRQIKDALNGLVCRCGTHGAALKAVKRAAGLA